MMERWTQAEEAELQRLTERRAQLWQKCMAPLMDLVRTSLSPSMSVGATADAMVGKAAAFRDALAPFDPRTEMPLAGSLEGTAGGRNSLSARPEGS